ncbi:MAG: hypothetical protein IJB14_04705 [Firmicutes bacterium]|nr:hypothetical protein [Bacillota bacterium]
MDNARYNLKMYSGLLLFLGIWDVLSMLPKAVGLMAVFKGAATSPIYVLVSTLLFVVLLVAKLWLGFNGRRYVKSGSQEPTTKLVEFSKLAGYAVIAFALLTGIGIFADIAKAGDLLPPAITLVVLNWYKKAARQCMWR